MLTFSCIGAIYAGRFYGGGFDNIAQEGQKNVYYGKPNPAQESCDSFDVDICPDLILAGAAAAGAAAFLALYLAITQNANGRRRKKRAAAEIGNEQQPASSPDPFLNLGEFIHNGTSLLLALSYSLSNSHYLLEQSYNWTLP